MTTDGSARDQVAGVVLAGGLSRRMGGGDKALLAVGGGTILDLVIQRTMPQVCSLILNANGDPQRFSAYGLPVVPDSVGGYAGPLAGILTGLEWVRDHHPGISWVASVAADTPLLPADLVERLLAAVMREGADLGCAMSAGQTHPVFALWPVRLAEELRHALVDEDMRKIDRWTARYRVALVEWPLVEWIGGEADPFFNVNTPDELAKLREMVEKPPAP